MNSGKDGSNYQSYLLRLWCSGDTRRWRATIEEVHTGQLHGFANLQQLVTFIETQTQSKISLDPDDEDSRK